MKSLIKENIRKPRAMIQTNVKGLSLTQRKLINFMISMVQSKGDHNVYETRIGTIKKLCNINMTENKFLKKQLKALEDITIEFDYLRKEEEVWEAMKIISAVRISKRTGCIEFEVPYMLKEKILAPHMYAPLNISLIAGLNSKYAIVLYELLRDYKNAPAFPKLTIEQFRTLLGLDDQQYKEFQNFKKRVLVPAVREINSKTDLKCEYELIKKGRHYVAIQFTVSINVDFDLAAPIPLDKKNLHLFYDPRELPPKVVSALPSEYQINAVFRILEPYLNDIEMVVSNILYCKKKKPDDFIAYLRSSLKKDFGHALREVHTRKQQLKNEKKTSREEERLRQNVLKQKAWDYFKSLPDPDRLRMITEAEEKMSAALKIVKVPERKKDIVNAQIEKDVIGILESRGEG
jgi:hypothetical protein